MSTYWNQFTHAEIMSMIGAEFDAYLDDSHFDRKEEIEEEGCCGRCMNCLGLSWSDFI